MFIVQNEHFFRQKKINMDKQNQNFYIRSFEAYKFHK